MTCKNVTYDVFSNTRKVGLNWFSDATFANYTGFCQPQHIPKFKCTPQDQKVRQP